MILGAYTNMRVAIVVTDMVGGVEGGTAAAPAAGSKKVNGNWPD